jgi:hypothetical protein
LRSIPPDNRDGGAGDGCFEERIVPMLETIQRQKSEGETNCLRRFLHG